MTLRDHDIERAVRELAPRPDREPDWEAMVDSIMSEVDGVAAAPVVPLFRRPAVLAAVLAAAAVAIVALSPRRSTLELPAVVGLSQAPPELPRPAEVESLDAGELAALDTLLAAEITSALAAGGAIDWIADAPDPAWADALASVDSLSERELARLASSLD